MAQEAQTMPVGLPSAVDTAEPDRDLEVVQLLCIGGLTLSLYLLHVFPISIANAMTLLTCTG
jgi:hypothetical protein